MTEALDMALDDLIQKNKQSSRGGSKTKGGAPRNGPRRGAGPVRRNNRLAPRSAPYSFHQSTERAPDGHWQHDMFEEVAGPAPLGPNTGIETGTKLFISNLQYGVSNEDIKELFSEVGDLKRCTIHFDRSGRSKGTAEVVYSRRADALEAHKRYHNVHLDGNPMVIKVVGTNLPVPNRAVKPGASNGSGVPPTRETSVRRGFRGPFTRGRGRGRGGNKLEKSAEDLDAELDNYHAAAMKES